MKVFLVAKVAFSQRPWCQFTKAVLSEYFKRFRNTSPAETMRPYRRYRSGSGAFRYQWGVFGLLQPFGTRQPMRRVPAECGVCLPGATAAWC